ncbi:hypothetical protein P9281_27420 [Caballeronia sp. LP003]|uniref:phage tail tube protein n=1 Tax=Caballeronia sp. LP003 TaxID=3038551 RepID=UPI002862FCF7|nr:hypothetical protein [Caballeronia sp. LP003]MDR5790280.1 hypothetical protein [Caballeronia sp. LP003]
MYLEDLNDAAYATGALVSASASDPVYVVFDDVSKLKNGEPIHITGTGWASLDNQAFVLQDLDTNAKTAALYGSDATGETAEFSDLAMWSLNTFVDLCARTYSIQQTPATSIDTTTLCDDEKTSLVGFRDPGTFTFDFFIDPTDPAYESLLEAYDDGEERMLEIVYRNKAVRTLPVIVQSISETGGVDQAVAGSCTMKITGAPVLTQPPDSDQPAEQYNLSVAVTPASGDAPLHVDMQLTETGGAAAKYAIDWKDGSAVETLVGAKTTTHVYNNEGSFEASVTATVGNKAQPAAKANPVTVAPGA